MNPYGEQHHFPALKKGVIFISDLRNINRHLKFNPYTIPKTSKIISKREGFKYAKKPIKTWDTIIYDLVRRQVTRVQL